MRRSRKKTAGSAIRPARSPVLAIRVPAPVLDDIKRAAATAGMTISDYAAQLIMRGQEWQEVIGDARGLLQQAKAEAKRLVNSTLETELRRLNWRPEHGTGKWLPPEVHGLPPNGFGPGTAADEDLFPDRQPEQKKEAS